MHGSVKVPGKAGDGDDNDARTTRSVDDAHYALKTRTWRVMNGERAVLTEDEATVLVEAGVLSEVKPASGERGIGATDEEEHLVSLTLDPLFLEAFRRQVVTKPFLGNLLLNAGRNASALGFAFEGVVAVALSDAMFPVAGKTSLAQGPLLGGAVAGGTFPLELDGVWRAFPTRLGRIVERCDLVEWFHRTLRIARDPCSVEAEWLMTACAPDNNAGPDLAFFVRRWRAGAGDGKPYDAIGLVLVQDKLAMDVDEVDASLRLDPRLLYHRNRASAPVPVESQAERVRALVEELHVVAVFRVLVSGVEGAGRGAKAAAARAGEIANAVNASSADLASTVRTTVEAAAAASTQEPKPSSVALVRHGRSPSKHCAFPNDAYVALRPSALAQVLGVDTAELVKALKASRSSYE